MRTFSRIGLVSAFAFAGLFATSAAVGRQSEPPTLTAAANGAVFAVKDAAGKYLALHFLVDAGAERSALAHDYVTNRAAVAGVRHIFIHPGESGQAKAWAAELGDSAKDVFTDPGHALAANLKVPLDGNSTTVVLDPAGKELFRHTGNSHADRLTFDEFAVQMAQTTRRSTANDYNLPQGKTLAVEGYDLVAYFRLNKAVKGKAELASTYRGITYHFSTPENRELFAADPVKYLPTYGGWCASAMGAKGTKVEIDPTNFKIKDGRLHLFYRSTFGDALKDWNKHEKEWEPAADANWKKLTGEDPVKPIKPGTP